MQLVARVLCLALFAMRCVAHLSHGGGCCVAGRTGCCALQPVTRSGAASAVHRRLAGDVPASSGGRQHASTALPAAWSRSVLVLHVGCNVQHDQLRRGGRGVCHLPAPVCLHSSVSSRERCLPVLHVRLHVWSTRFDPATRLQAATRCTHSAVHAADLSGSPKQQRQQQ